MKTYYIEESKHVVYLDENNSYGYVMSKFLPAREFKLTDPKEYDLDKYTSNSSKGCFLEVVLEYLEGITKITQ